MGSSKIPAIVCYLIDIFACRGREKVCFSMCLKGQVKLSTALLTFRLQVKLSIAGKNIVKEDDFDELTSDSFKDYDVSSISGSEDEADKEIQAPKGSAENVKQKLFVRLQTGERVSVWKCLIVDESENVLFESDKAGLIGSEGIVPCLREDEVIDRLKGLIHEPRDKTHLRIVLLASGGHFAGCVFDGNFVVAHKTFHRLVYAAKYCCFNVFSFASYFFYFKMDFIVT